MSQEKNYPPELVKAYYGWPNWATWVTFTTLASEDASRKWLERGAKKTKALEFASKLVEKRVKDTIHNFTQGHSNADNAFKLLIQSFLIESTHWLNYRAIYAGLIADKEQIDSDVLTVAAFELLRTKEVTHDWQEIAEDASLGAAYDTRLKTWLQDTVLVWVDPGAYRIGEQKSIHVYCEKALNVLLDIIDWERVTLAFRGAE